VHEVGNLKQVYTMMRGQKNMNLRKCLLCVTWQCPQCVI